MLGNFYELLAMLCAMGYTLILKHLSARYSPFLLTAMVAFVGSVFSAGVVQRAVAQQRQPVGAGCSRLIRYCGNGGGLWPLQLRRRRLPASQASGFTNLIPVFNCCLPLCCSVSG